jgi:hypothetical protein
MMNDVGGGNGELPPKLPCMLRMSRPAHIQHCKLKVEEYYERVKIEKLERKNYQLLMQGIYKLSFNIICLT